jgi:hypothetical protein
MEIKIFHQILQWYNPFEFIISFYERKFEALKYILNQKVLTYLAFISKLYTNISEQSWQLDIFLLIYLNLNTWPNRFF